MFSSSGKNWYTAHAEETLVLYLSYNSGTKLRSTMEQQILKRSIGFQTGGEGRERERKTVGTLIDFSFLFFVSFVFFFKVEGTGIAPWVAKHSASPIIKVFAKTKPFD